MMWLSDYKNHKKYTHNPVEKRSFNEGIKKKMQECGKKMEKTNLKKIKTNNLL